MCISHFGNRSMGTKDPLPSRRRFIQSFLKNQIGSEEKSTPGYRSESPSWWEGVRMEGRNMVSEPLGR